MKPHRNIFARLLAIPFLLLTSCVLDMDPAVPTPAEEGSDVRILIHIPGRDIPSTRAMGDKENKIETIDVLVFKTVGGAKVFSHHSQGVIESNSLTAGNAEFTVSLLTESSLCDIAVIANARNSVESKLGVSGGIHPGDTKASVLEKLTFRNTSAWKADGDSAEGYLAIPMYGEVTDVSITTSTTYSMSLRRMLARIDIKNMASSNFTISKVYLANSMTDGYIAPPWNSAGVVKTNMRQPNLSWSTEPTRHHAYDLSAAGVATGYSQVYEGEIYSFESEAAFESDIQPSLRRDATCLIFEGYLDGSAIKSYYRVDFTYDDDYDSEGVSKGDYMPLLRNHKYIVELELAEGTGYRTFHEARYSYTQKSNLRTRIIYYEDGIIKDIVYNGRNMLGVESSTLEFDWLGEPQTDYVVTDYNYNGWSYSVDYGGGNTVWLSVSRDTGLGNLRGTLTVEPEVSLLGTAERTAYIVLTAGDLKHTITVTQKAGQDHTSYIQPVSNCYIVKPGSDVIFIPVDPANDQTVKALIGVERDPIHGTIMLGTPVLWSDNPEGIGRNTPIRHVKPTSNLNTDRYYVVVFPGMKEGNTIVGVNTFTDNNKEPIHWSWHIWNTNYDPNVDYSISSLDGNKWMDRNLGALSNNWVNEGTVGDKVIGLYYQWGRKDPFPNTNDPAYVLSGYEVTAVSGRATTFSETVLTPLICTTGYDWDGSNGNISWIDNGAKTVFDPCPAGWRVPIYSAWGHNPVETVVGDVGNLKGMIFLPTSDFLPAAGRRHGKNVQEHLITNDYTGEYWTATPLSTYACETRFNSSSSSHNMLERVFMLPVRCVKERFY